MSHVGDGPTQHVVCFEEAGDCTLEHIARCSAPGDRVVVLGPERFALTLRALKLHEAVEIDVLGRVAGRYRRPQRRDGLRVRAYGARASAALGIGAEPAPTPSELPPSPEWTAERRARVRRALGVAPHDVAVALVGEPAEWIDPSLAVRACAMARVAGAPLRLVASPRTHRVEVLSGFFEQASGGRPILTDERLDRPWEILPALDAVILDQDGLATMPTDCAGWRGVRSGERSIPPQAMSPLPALWALASGIAALVHAGVDLGVHAGHPMVTRFSDDVAELARGVHARASSAVAASR